MSLKKSKRKAMIMRYTVTRKAKSTIEFDAFVYCLSVFRNMNRKFTDN